MVISKQRLLQVTVGGLIGAYTAGACSPVLFALPMPIGAALLIFVLGGTVILAVTAEDIRDAVGRCLVSFGSALIALPILSLLVGALSAAPPSIAGIKADRLKPDLQPAVEQVIAACVAFGGGALISVGGMVIMMNGRRDRAALKKRLRAASSPVRPRELNFYPGGVESVGKSSSSENVIDHRTAGDEVRRPDVLENGKAVSSPEKGPAVRTPADFAAGVREVRGRPATVVGTGVATKAAAVSGVVGGKPHRTEDNAGPGGVVSGRSPRPFPSRTSRNGPDKLPSPEILVAQSVSANDEKAREMSSIKDRPAGVSEVRITHPVGKVPLAATGQSMSSFRDRLRTVDRRIRPSAPSRMHESKLPDVATRADATAVPSNGGGD